MNQEFSDSELIKRFHNNEGNDRNYCFNLLVKKYQKKVYFLVVRMVIDHDDANDLVQNTFIKAWKNLENFREECQFYTWLFRIATNESLNFLKQKKLRYFLPIVNVEAELEKKLSATYEKSPKQIEYLLQQAILKLPEKQRIVFNLRYYDEMRYDEISEILGTSVGALKASYHHAATKIEKFLNGH